MPGRGCNHCSADVIWIYLVPSGKRMPINAEAIPVAQPRLVAFNHDTGKGKVLSRADCEAENPEDEPPAYQWAAKARVTFHKSHFTDTRCPVVRERNRARKAKTKETA